MLGIAQNSVCSFATRSLHDTSFDRFNRASDLAGSFESFKLRQFRKRHLMNCDDKVTRKLPDFEIAIIHLASRIEHPVSANYRKPRARNFCIALRSWWSWARPARSLVRVVSSSAMISSIVFALLSIGFVIGLQPNER